jgi:2-dehydro-3-deoxyphosphogluconate aldolase/(4S)-4-hydroxy-2-oxoglutarate aldolase
MEATLNQIANFGVLPVIKIDDAKDAAPLAQALIDGGLPAAEVTFRTAAAEEAIRNISSAFPEMLVGAGTVLTPEQARTALNAGAKFIVAPGFNPHVVDFCQEQGVLVTPGISTPTELEAALGKNLKVLKFFPAESMGGLSYLKSMSAPFGGIKFIPTGGIDAGNILSYLKFNKVLACGGSWMVTADLISQKKFSVITALVAEAIQTILGFKIKGIRLNAPISAQNAAQQLFKETILLPTERNDHKLSVNKILELTDQTQTGEIVLGTNFVDRALNYFERKGISWQTVGEKIVLDVEMNGLKIVLEAC